MGMKGRGKEGEGGKRSRHIVDSRKLPLLSLLQFYVNSGTRNDSTILSHKLKHDIVKGKAFMS